MIDDRERKRGKGTCHEEDRSNNKVSENIMEEEKLESTDWNNALYYSIIPPRPSINQWMMMSCELIHIVG